MNNDREPTEVDINLISNSIEFNTDNLTEPQKIIQCPNVFIVKMTNKVLSKYHSSRIMIRREK